tara:strand:+ start:284 stop:550 length:267 start_codon:yes stop_codon:yes gene_type:complete
MQPGEIGKHRRLFHARSIINVVGLLGSSPRVAVQKQYLGIKMKQEPKPVKSFNGISVALLRGALGPHYMKEWTKEQIKEYEDWVGINS